MNAEKWRDPHTLDLFDPLPAAVPDVPAIAPTEQIDPVAASSDQLDLFRDSPSELSGNAARRALRQFDVVSARHHLAALRGLPAYAAFVADCEHCLELIERSDPRWAAAAQAIPWIEAVLEASALRCLGAAATTLVEPALRALLDRCERPFDPERRHAHLSDLWRRLGQPAQAVAALEEEAAWRNSPAGRIWHAELSEAAHCHERVLADVYWLCLHAPDAAEDWLSASPGWRSRWSDWCELDDALPIEAFPAWCRLTRAVGFAMPCEDDQQAGAEWLRSACRLAQNPDSLPLRKALRTQSPDLLAIWLTGRRGPA